MKQSPALAAGRPAIRGQFLRFIAVGLLSTLLDGITYRFALAAIDINLAKALGYLVGMSCSIACNYHWSFGYTGGRSTAVVAKSVLVYLLALGLNVAVNRCGILLLGTDPYGTTAAFLLAVGASTMFNFAGLRGWAFR